MTHKKQIENKIKKDGFVDNFWCIENKITTRLGAVINVLRNEGWEFDDERCGYLHGTKNWRYYLKDLPKIRKQVVENLPNGSVRVYYVDVPANYQLSKQK